VAPPDQATATGGRNRRRGEARTYDFRRPVRLAREHAHVLRVAMQTFTRQATTVLTTSLRTLCSVSSVSLDEMSYDEYLTSLPDKSVCAVLSMAPLSGKALLTIDQGMYLAMLDLQLGGPGSEEQPDRPLTDIEQALVRQLLIRLLRELAYALEPIDQINPELLALEGNAQFVQAAAATDPVVVAVLELSVGTRNTEMKLCLPYAMLGPALEALTRSGQDGDRTRLRQEASFLTSARLSDVAVDVSVRFDPIRLVSQQIGQLAIGDVLTLNHRTTAPLTVVSANTTFARATPGASGRRLAVLITDTPPHPVATS
jgi:flagellar motor switch protein FliM